MSWKLVATTLLFLIVVVPAQAGSPIPWCQQQDLFFWNASSADISGYRILENYPELVSDRIIVSPSVSSATGEKTIATFIVPKNELQNSSTIYPGLWRFRGYFNVSSDVGITRVHYYLINRTSTGTEKVLFYGTAISQDINGATPSEFLHSYARRNTTDLFPGDRFAIRINVSSTSTTPRTVTFNIGGNERTSMVAMAYFHCPDVDFVDIDDFPQPMSGNEALGAAMGLLGGIIGGILIVRRKMK